VFQESNDAELRPPHGCVPCPLRAAATERFRDGRRTVTFQDGWWRKTGSGHRDLMPWLNDPYQAPPALAGVHDGQLALTFSKRRNTVGQPGFRNNGQDGYVLSLQRALPPPAADLDNSGFRPALSNPEGSSFCKSEESPAPDAGSFCKTTQSTPQMRSRD